MGGIFGDKFKQRHPAGRLLIGYIAVFGTAPLVLWMVYTDSLYMAFALNFAHHLFSAAWVGIPPSTAADLVLPRMRAVAGAYYILINTMLGLALGPYVMGQLSDSFASTGYGLRRVTANCHSVHAADFCGDRGAAHIGVEKFTQRRSDKVRPRSRLG